MTHSMKTRGFTLVETLVAITIMTLAILGPFEAVERVVAQSRLAQDQLVAASLAQEGLEYVRFIRYNNYLESGMDSGVDYLDGIDASPKNCTGTNKCTIDAKDSIVAQCSGACTPPYIDSEGFYNQQSSGTKSIFTRSMSVSHHSAVNGADSSYDTATVTITWTDHGSQSMTLTENFYDWL